MELRHDQNGAIGALSRTVTKGLPVAKVKNLSPRVPNEPTQEHLWRVSCAIPRARTNQEIALAAMSYTCALVWHSKRQRNISQENL